MKHNKILILGSSGMLGSELTKQFYNTSGIDVAIALRTLEKYPKYITEGDKRVNFIVIEDDLNFYKDLYHELSNDNYLVVNCIGVTNRFESNKPKDILNMIQTNSILPNVLGMLQQEFKESTFINISTNCVFKDGKKLDDSFYALSKRLGESPSLINLRTSIIGEEQDNALNLVEWLKKQKGFVNGYTKAFWNGVTTKEVFNIINEFNINNSFPKVGTYNITSSNIVSKYELLNLLKDRFGLDIIVKPDSSFKEDKTLKHSLKLCYKQKTVEKMIEEIELR
jgi:dTDP-4-dehydrorhamnose reductase